MVILEFVVEAFPYTKFMVSRVNDTPFPYTRVYSQPISQPTRGRGRSRGRVNSHRGADKGGAPKGAASATPKRVGKTLEQSSMQKKAKPAEPAANKHGDIIKQLCQRSGLPAEQLLDQFIANAPNLAPKPK